MTIGNVIAYNLSLDAYNIQEDPVNIYNVNPSVFSSSSNVPPFLYTPLYTLLGCASSDLSNRIIPDYGEGRIPSGPCIVIQPTELYESATLGNGNRSDITGARTTKIAILVKNVVTDKNIFLVDQVLNRVTYLLDYLCRENRTGGGLAVDFADLIIPPTASGFYQSPFRCQFECTYLPIASAGYSTFNISYYLTFV